MENEVLMMVLCNCMYLVKRAEENWVPGQVDMLKRLMASELNSKEYDQVTEEEIKELESRLEKIRDAAKREGIY